MSELPSAMGLSDPQGRSFRYLRLSVTDACNFKCTYCLPNGYRRPEGAAGFLSLSEIGHALDAFAGLGVEKVRVTGGEPTLRRDIEAIVSRAAATPGVRRVALTTNGWRLKQLAPRLKAAGLTDVNVSIDSLDRGRFHRITGIDRLDAVMDGVNECLALGFRSVKVNAVRLKGQNDEDLWDFLRWIRRTPVSVRFIELMPTADNGAFFKERHAGLGEVRSALQERGFVARLRGVTDGPAEVFEHPDYAGTIGLIAPYAKDFCARCNRLRLSSRGDLHLCLFGGGGHSVRHLMQSADQRVELQRTLVDLLHGKTAAHRLHSGDFGATRNLASIGG